MRLTHTERQDIDRIVDLGKYTTVLLILFRLYRPVTVADTARLAHINPETARAHLRALAERQLITRGGDGWILTAGGRQLVLPTAENPRLESHPAENPRTLLKDSSSSFKTLNSKRDESEAKEEQESAENPRGRGFSARSEIDPAILAAYREVGIGLNARTRRLARQPWITAEYIRAHHAYLAARGKGNCIGLLITILESAEPAPEPEPEPEPAPDDGSRYITGKFANLIHH